MSSRIDRAASRALQDEEDRSQVELDVPVAGVGDVGLDLGVEGALHHVLGDG